MEKQIFSDFIDKYRDAEMVVIGIGEEWNAYLEKQEYQDLLAFYATYLEKPIVKEALKTKNTVGIGKQREVVLFFIKHRMYLMLDMMGKIRKWQKEHR